MKHEYDIVGGMFGKEPLLDSVKRSPCFLSTDGLRLFNARSGLYILCDLLRPMRIWLPSFICPALIEAVPRAFKICFYPISKELTISEIGWIDSLDERDLVVFVDYFGFNLHEGAMKYAKAKGAWILQDAAQALLSDFNRQFADFVVYSPRKFVGVPDGGILVSKCSLDLNKIKLDSAPASLVDASFAAFDRRSRFDENGTTPWFNLFKQSETMNHAGYFRISETANEILESGVCYDEISRVRRTNYQILASGLAEQGLLKTLPDHVVPLGFPVWLDRRDKVMNALHEAGIFCPVHWRVALPVPEWFEEAHALSRHILTLICDQRMSGRQLNRMMDIVRRLI